jgi:glycerophosphoryl diester phosphodiesterase
VFSGKLKLNLELKEFSAGVEVLSLLHQYPDAEIVISSFDWSLLKDLRKLDETLPLAVLFDEGNWRQGLRLASEISACSFHPSNHQVCRIMVTACRKRFLPVSVWTVDSPERASSLVRMGVSGLFTNDPGELRSARPTLVSSRE